MANLEWIVKNQYDLRVWLCELACIAKCGTYCNWMCGDCKFGDNKRVLEVLNEEHEEKD